MLYKEKEQKNLIKFAQSLGSFQSGQMGQTVNLLLLASVVRIHHYPQKSCSHLITTLLFYISIKILPTYTLLHYD